MSPVLAGGFFCRRLLFIECAYWLIEVEQTLVALKLMNHNLRATCLIECNIGATMDAMTPYSILLSLSNGVRYILCTDVWNDEISGPTR